MSSTIVALSSGPLPSGVAIVRMSGPGVVDVLEKMAGGPPPPRHMALRSITRPDGSILDRALVVFFPGPNSFTGEDCAEFHLHGSRAVINAVLNDLTSIVDVEMAEAGAFTRRAFENGRLDLTEIEGLGDLIAAQTEGQRQQALVRASGGLGRHISVWREELVSLRAEIEANLDFSDEDDVPESLPPDFKKRLSELTLSLEAQIATYSSARIVREGFRVVLAGPPNAGKSSLLNALVQSDLAIVSNEPGTTRDVREVPLDLGGQLVLFYDVAGFRQTASVAEGEGIRRAKLALEQANLVLWLRAPDVAGTMPADADARYVEIHTKSDIRTPAPGPKIGIAVSVHQSQGIAGLLGFIKARAAQHINSEPGLVSHIRDRDALERAVVALSEASRSELSLEVRAEALRGASTILERWLGLVDAEMVLDRLFAGFCIGK